MSQLSTYDKVRRLVNFATGEEWGDGTVVMTVNSDGWAHETYTHGDFTDRPVIVLGNWNPTSVDGLDRWTSDDPRVTMPVRLARSLERVGAVVEWYDQYDECHGCNRVVQTEPDSYSWTPQYAWTEDGFYCAQCLLEDPEDYLTEYVNDARKAVTWCEPSDLEALGFAKWAPDDPQDYQSGWHPHQTDDPTDILAGILEEHPDAQVVFYIDGTGQFDVSFSAYVRGLDATD